MKIIIRENQLKKIIKEEINASDAYDDFNSIITLIRKKRGVGLIDSYSFNTFKKLIQDNNIKFIRHRKNHRNYIIFVNDYENLAMELYNIMNKYDGYVAFYATEEDTRRIGEILGYKKEDINKYIKKHRYHLTGVNPY